VRVGVVGLGLIGGSLLQRLAAVPGFEARGFDADAGTRAEVAAAGFAVDADVCGWAEVVAVAVPPRATAAVVAEALAAGHAAVFDVASVKAPVVAAVRAAAPADTPGRFVPAHPLAGSERGGWSSARPDLLESAVWAICPHDLSAPLEPLAAVARVLDALDARLSFCTPEDHDAAVARSSHVPHVVAQALAATIDTPLAAVLSGGALRDGTRVAAANPDMWDDVLVLNGDAVVPALAALEGEIVALLERIGDGDHAAVRAAGLTAAAAKHRVETLRWRDPNWQAETLPSRAWERLIAAGRDGRLARRLRVTSSIVELDLSVLPRASLNA
jgi:prephenate dehydrogenase